MQQVPNQNARFDFTPWVSITATPFGMRMNVSGLPRLSVYDAEDQGGLLYKNVSREAVLAGVPNSRCSLFFGPSAESGAYYLTLLVLQLTFVLFFHIVLANGNVCRP